MKLLSNYVLFLLVLWSMTSCKSTQSGILSDKTNEAGLVKKPITYLLPRLKALKKNSSLDKTSRTVYEDLVSGVELNEEIKAFRLDYYQQQNNSKLIQVEKNLTQLNVHSNYIAELAQIKSQQGFLDYFFTDGIANADKYSEQTFNNIVKNLEKLRELGVNPSTLVELRKIYSELSSKNTDIAWSRARRMQKDAVITVVTSAVGGFGFLAAKALASAAIAGAVSLGALPAGLAVSGSTSAAIANFSFYMIVSRTGVTLSYFGAEAFVDSTERSSYQKYMDSFWDDDVKDEKNQRIAKLLEENNPLEISFTNGKAVGLFVANN